MRPFPSNAFCASLAILVLVTWSPVWGQDFTFFANTQYPLNVHFLEGIAPGPTVMVQGGIQGDEVAGFISAQILTRARLENGKLIVVPRANIPSIMARSRQINVDLNRRFDQDYNQFYEDRLARCIRLLISRADAFIHLHEGSGFYSQVYQNALRGPKRFGQSVIIDQAVCCDGFDLAGLVESVLTDFNQSLPRNYRFTLMNTRTSDPGSVHPEQRKSLSFYAVNQRGIPAMAVEVSKDIVDLEWKVRAQVRLTLAFLRSMGLEVYLEQTELDRIRDWFGNPVPVDLNCGDGQDSGVTLRLGEMLNPQPAPEAEDQKAVGVFASDRPGQNMVSQPRRVLRPFQYLDVIQDGVRVARIPVS
ncbi:MAG: hypothetical protein EOM25_01520 [Deltaproteobacteria bacterium]|nr:hypothetical protein [Deltaproteobacteria bacterium]